MTAKQLSEIAERATNGNLMDQAKAASMDRLALLAEVHRQREEIDELEKKLCKELHVWNQCEHCCGLCKDGRPPGFKDCQLHTKSVMKGGPLE